MFSFFFMLTTIFFKLKNKLKNLFDFYISMLDNLFSHNPKLLNLLVNFFDYSSKFTSIILMDLRFYIPLLFIIYNVPIFCYESFINFLFKIHQDPYSFENYKKAFLNLDTPLMMEFVFFIFLFELVIFNTFLATIPCIKKEMFIRYNDQILKERGYNGLFSSTSRFIGLGTVVLASIMASVRVYETGRSFDIQQAQLDIQRIQALNEYENSTGRRLAAHEAIERSHSNSYENYLAHVDKHNERQLQHSIEAKKTGMNYRYNKACTA